MPYEVFMRGEHVTFENYGESKGRPQIFNDLLDEAGQEGRLFEDEQFPPHLMLLARKGLPETEVDWLRPHDISPNPVLFAEGQPRRSSIRQGCLGDCWLLAAFAGLTERPDLQELVFPNDNIDFDHQDYRGIFHFRFFADGKWIDISIDDRLPTLNGELIYAHSSNDNEFWPALLEKAYAKRFGSYDHLTGGRTCEGWQDFSGGVTSSSDLRNCSTKVILTKICTALAQNYFVGASMRHDPIRLQALDTKGLVNRHAYSILKVLWIKERSEKYADHTVLVPILLLRNPWGHGEWTGDWCRDSTSWTAAPAWCRTLAAPQNLLPGEFYISVGDFVKFFHLLETCDASLPLAQQGIVPINDDVTWIVSSHDAIWLPLETSGGSDKNAASYISNPKHAFTIDGANSKWVLIGQLFKDHRQTQWRNEGISSRHGFAVFHVEADETILDSPFFLSHEPVIMSNVSMLREESIRFLARPGRYVVVSHGQTTAAKGAFLLRIHVKEEKNRFSLEPKLYQRIRNYAMRHPVPPSSTLPPFDCLLMAAAENGSCQSEPIEQSLLEKLNKNDKMLSVDPIVREPKMNRVKKMDNIVVTGMHSKQCRV